MAQEDVDNVRAGYDAFVRGDREAIVAVLDPDATWYPAMGALLERTSYHGRDAICDLILREIPSVLEGFHADLIDVEDLGDSVLATVRFSGTARSSGLPIEQTFFQLFFRLRNHKALEMRSFTSRAAALDAAHSSRARSENVERVQRAHDAFNRGDLEEVLEHFHPDAEWIPYLAGLEARSYRGHAALRDMWRSLRENFRDFRIEPREIIDRGEQLVLVVDAQGSGPHSGAEVKQTWAQVVTIRDGLISRVEPFSSRAEALRAIEPE